MRPRNGMATLGVLSFVVILTDGCSTPPPTPVDHDASVPDVVLIDARADRRDGDSPPDPPPACGPLDTTGYTPVDYWLPSGKHQNKCTTQNLADYVSCITGADKTKCAQFGQGQPAAACGGCIETPATGAPRGPLVSPDGKNLNFNVSGCLDLVVPNTSCGKVLEASYGCQDAACGMCDDTTTPNFGACVTGSLKKVCKSYGDAVTPACAAQFGDAAPSDVAICSPDGTIVDAKARQTDWVKRMTTYFCGP